MDKHTGLYCSHIESKIPKFKRKPKQEFQVENIDAVAFFEAIASLSPEGTNIEEQLANFGLDPYEVELILLRFVDGKSMKQIMKEQGWLSLNSANHYLRAALWKLRNGGFKIESSSTG